MRSIMEKVFFFFDDRDENRYILITTEILISWYHYWKSKSILENVELDRIIK